LGPGHGSGRAFPPQADVLVISIFGPPIHKLM
jgi:hypothetical protein